MKQRIKQIWSCAIMLAAVLLTGCNNVEETLFTGEEPQAQTGKLSFIIPLGGSKTVTYATVNGEDDEYELENLSIYWFQYDGTDYKLFKPFYWDASGGDITISDGSLTAGDNTRLAQIEVGDETTQSRFYIVANVNGSSITSNTLANAAIGMLSTDFENIIADALAASDSLHIKCPLPMSISKATTTATGGSSGYVEVSNPSTEGTVTDVHLKRRVARFDVLNNKEWTNFEVTKIYANRAQKTGWLHDRNFALTDSYVTTDAVAIFDGSGANGSAVDMTDNWMEPDPSDPTGNTAGSDGIPDIFQNNGAKNNDAGKYEQNKRIFYLFPTVLRANWDDVNSLWLPDPTDGTEIVIEGKFYNVTRLYRLNLKADVNIDANKVYAIKVNRLSQTQLKFNLLTVDHWEEADTLGTANISSNVSYGTSEVAAQGTAAASVSTFDLTTLNAVNNLEYTSTQTDSVKITIRTEGTNKSGPNGHTTTVGIKSVGAAGADFLQSDLDELKAHIVSETKMTYAAHFVTTHTITLPPTDAPIHATLEIKNPANDADNKVIGLYSNNYDKTANKAAKVGDVLTANSRWAKAVVTSIDATGFPTNIVSAGYGRPAQVYALLGTTTSASFQTFASNTVSGGGALNIITYLNTNNGGTAPTPAGETYAANIADGAEVIPASLLSTVVTEFSLAARGTTGGCAGDGGYKAIVVNCDKTGSSGSNYKLPILDSTGKMFITYCGTNVDFAQSVITAALDY